MVLERLSSWAGCFIIAAMMTAASCLGAVADEVVTADAVGFHLGQATIQAGSEKISVQLDSGDRAMPFCQSALKMGTQEALLGPDPAKPYFLVRFALPIPPENMKQEVAAWAGVDPAVFTHNHSPGFEVLPNGDALAVWFSTPPGQSESAPTTTFIQARLRYGAEQWDMPELFLDFEGKNDQSGLLWNDHGKIWFFGGGRDLSPWVPFKMAVSTDEGETWTLSLPQLDAPATFFEAQPITSAFRGPDGTLYFAMDGAGAHSFLWSSHDEGLHWSQSAGRTGGRHSVVVPLDERGNLLSIGGKNASVRGYSPENLSTNFGKTWSASQPSPFPPLGSAQRPSMIRLSSGALFFVSDAYRHKLKLAPPAGWTHGNGCFVALSTNNGISWRIKELPVQLPNHEFQHWGTLGYVTARQAPNGVIHVLTTETQPCLDYEMNEAWVMSDQPGGEPENSGGKVEAFSEKYPQGGLRCQWTARICPGGRYLLDGLEEDFFPDGSREHEVTYAAGYKTGMESFWSPDGRLRWQWFHDLAHHHSIWTQFWPNGGKHFESGWDTKPQARDLARTFSGWVADGPAKEWAKNGTLVRTAVFLRGEYLMPGKGGS